MKLGEIVSRSIIDRRKLVTYALNPNNPVGQHKAVLFQSRLGYNLNTYEHLLEQIERLVMQGEAIATRLDEYGQRYQVDLVVAGVNDQTAIIRTAWIVEPEFEDCARLISLYVRK